MKYMMSLGIQSSLGNGWTYDNKVSSCVAYRRKLELVLGLNSVRQFCLAGNTEATCSGLLFVTLYTVPQSWLYAQKSPGICSGITWNSAPCEPVATMMGDCLHLSMQVAIKRGHSSMHCPLELAAFNPTSLCSVSYQHLLTKTWQSLTKNSTGSDFQVCSVLC